MIFNNMAEVTTKLILLSQFSTERLEALNKASKTGGTVLFGFATFSEIASIGVSVT